MGFETPCEDMLLGMKHTCHAVSAVRGTPAAALKSSLAGMNAASASGMAMYSA